MKKDRLDEQNDCLRRLGLYVAGGASVVWGHNGRAEYKFYLREFGGKPVAEGGTLQELIANIPKGE